MCMDKESSWCSLRCSRPLKSMLPLNPLKRLKKCQTEDYTIFIKLLYCWFKLSWRWSFGKVIMWNKWVFRKRIIKKTQQNWALQDSVHFLLLLFWVWAVYFLFFMLLQTQEILYLFSLSKILHLFLYSMLEVLCSWAFVLLILMSLSTDPLTERHMHMP